jgi:hypothetical protein
MRRVRFQSLIQAFRNLCLEGEMPLLNGRERKAELFLPGKTLKERRLPCSENVQ